MSEGWCVAFYEGIYRGIEEMCMEHMYHRIMGSGFLNGPVVRGSIRDFNRTFVHSLSTYNFSRLFHTLLQARYTHILLIRLTK